MTDLSRRAFLGMGAASALLAPGVYLYAREPDEAVTGAVRWGMLVDTRACQEDCDACVTACNEEHHLQDLGRPQTDAQWIRKLTLRDRSSGRVVSMPMMCQHCAHPPASTSARPGPRSAAKTASCWSTSTPASVAATA